uniref:Uncharacterized protein n=1 Tax=Anguilla anguilla TaxID=7936 RepID=A0A0E9QY54_ANGAN
MQFRESERTDERNRLLLPLLLHLYPHLLPLFLAS